MKILLQITSVSAGLYAKQDYNLQQDKKNNKARSETRLACYQSNSIRWLVKDRHRQNTPVTGFSSALLPETGLPKLCLPLPKAQVLNLHPRDRNMPVTINSHTILVE